MVSTIYGVDLSPQMIAVGKYLQTAVPNQELQWVDDFAHDPRIQLRLGDIAKLSFLADQSVHYVNLAYVLHELPYEVACAILQEINRVLVPGGVLSIMEMDPSAPGYRKARKNPALFAVFKSTEPYLNEYFDQTAPQMGTLLAKYGFGFSQVVAATGRHLCAVARKNAWLDLRPNEEMRLAMDEHLLPMQKPSDVKMRKG